MQLLISIIARFLFYIALFTVSLIVTIGGIFVIAFGWPTLYWMQLTLGIGVLLIASFFFGIVHWLRGQTIEAIDLAASQVFVGLTTAFKPIRLDNKRRN